MKIERSVWIGSSSDTVAANTLGWRCTTPAKINLFLEVLGKRPDGYHDLDTVMLAIDLTDTLEIYPTHSDALTLQLDLSEAQAVGKEQLAKVDRTWQIPTHGASATGNLVLRALEALRRELDSRAISPVSTATTAGRGAHVILKKRIPSQAGLGGGSSDAAAALVLGSLLWHQTYDPTLLGVLASKLGSDINFFLEGHNGRNWTARCTQRGEIVQPVANRYQVHGLIVHPPAGCSTAQVFSRVGETIADRSQAHGPDALLECLAHCPEDPNHAARLARLLYNRLDVAAVQTTEWVEQAARRIDRCNSFGQCLSGSGSARFCLCRDRPQAETMAMELRREGEFRAYPFSAWTSPSIADQVALAEQVSHCGVRSSREIEADSTIQRTE
jgi:4-diphosphocytidyl-2-C-methyl-D-erythritol kinase